jgi:hypothetical protein
VPRYGLVEELRAVKDEDELDAIRRAARDRDIAFERFADEGDVVGRTERELAWRFEQFLHEANADGVSFPATCRPARTRPSRTPIPATARASRRDAARRRGLHGRRLLLGLHAHVRHRPLPTSCSARTTSASTPSSPGSRRFGRAHPGRGRLGRARPDRGAGFGEAFGHGLGHGVGLVVHEDPRLAQESRSTLEAGNVVTVEPGIYLSGLGGIRIEISSSSRTTGPRS